MAYRVPEGVPPIPAGTLPWGSGNITGTPYRLPLITDYIARRPRLPASGSLGDPAALCHGAKLGQEALLRN